MKILMNKKVLIIPFILGLILLLFFTINRIPSEVLRSNILLSNIAVHESTSGTASASYVYFENYDQADKMAEDVAEKALKEKVESLQNIYDKN